MSINKERINRLGVLILCLFTLGAFATTVPWTFANGVGGRRIILQLLSAASPFAVDLVFLILGMWGATRTFHFKQDIVPIWRQVFFYSVTLAILLIGFGLVPYHFDQLWSGFLPVVLDLDSNVTVGILLLLLSPFLNKGLKQLPLKLLHRLLFILALVLTIVPTITGYPSALPVIDFASNPFTWGVFLYLCGWTLKQHSDWYSAHKVVLRIIFWSMPLLAAIQLLFSDFVAPKIGFFVGITDNYNYLLTNSYSLLIFAWAFTFLALLRTYPVRGWRLAHFLNPTILFGLYLVTNHYLFKNYLWTNVLNGQTILEKDGPLHLLLKLVVVVAALYIGAYLLELFRQYLFRRFSANWHSLVPILFVSLLMAVVANLYMLLVNCSFDAYLTAWLLTSQFWIQLINLLLIELFFLTLLAIFNRVFVAGGIFSITIIVIAVANYLKIGARNEPIMPMDIYSINDLPAIMAMVNLGTVAAAIIGVLAVIVLMAWLERHFKTGKILKWKSRVTFLVITPLVYGFLIWKLPDYKNNFATQTKSPTNYVLKKLNFLPYPQAPVVHLRYNGEFMGILSMVRVKTMYKPSGYSEQSINRVVRKYEKEAQQINQTRKGTIGEQTVIYVLSESYANPNRVPGVTLSKNPAAYLDSIKKNNTSGLMDSYGYGGGTADIEFEALTSLSMDNFSASMTVPYTYVVPKVNHIPVITNLFQTKTAIHPYTPYLYNRTNVFKKFGFQKFYNTESSDKLTYTKQIGKSPYISDDSAYKQLLKQVNATNKGQFIQLSTMQNHTPWDSDYYHNTIKATGDLTSSSLKSVETYSQGLVYTDSALKMLMKHLKSEKKDVTVVWYGDHLPGAYTFKSENSAKMKKYDNKMHLTDYFIYSNHSKKNVSRKVVTPNMFTSMMLEQTNTRVSGYYALMTEILDHFPAAERNKLMNNEGQYISESKLTKKQKTLLHDYQLIQYDITASHNQYSYDKANKSFYSDKK
ncbi:hypothetical protein IV38_GL000708 [Lactobacillus selangorensis]|uniref:Sulfatase N-terminal domain-containing protein n=1 Tax=Lactobacillus selangorensis TaxID=81857 RepID=A0A0R2FQH0_9LACO|nr:sulfatase-like hydrolase/transferase [Lactobacillus selangorensis]KRN27216.1 hypothetical protein IV38_GL000708 [Lactobacillus selangorensis]KRN29862.1 hypothetical protein IV40_GL000570 [Lactobacillus selangorensis]